MLKRVRDAETRVRREFEKRHGVSIKPKPAPPCPFPNFWTHLGENSVGDPLIGAVPIPGTESKDRIGMRSDIVELAYRKPDGGLKFERGYRLLSYPHIRNQQRRRQGVISQHVARDLGNKTTEHIGKRYLGQAGAGFLDIPGCLFSLKHRVWANQIVARAVADEVPEDIFGFLTVLSGVVPSLSISPFDDPNWIKARVTETLVRLGRALRDANAKWVYLNGYWEIIDKCEFINSTGRYHFDWRMRNWSKATRDVYWDDVQFIPHLHGLLLAHDGTKWIKRKTLFRHLRAEFAISQEVLLTRRHMSSKDAAINIMAYANKPAWEAAYSTIVQDAIMRTRVRKPDLWPEGWFHFGDEFNSIPLDVLQRIRLRADQIDMLELLGAAVGFAPSPRRWPW